MPYKRNINRQIGVYRITIFLLLSCSITLVCLGKFSYAGLFITAYLIRDFIFSVTEIAITNETLSITKYYVGGFVKLKTSIDKMKIIAVKNIDTGISTDNQIDFEIGIFSPTGNDAPKRFELYRIDYQGRSNQVCRKKVQLSKEEEELLH